eukprot:gene7905-8101_t
MAEQAKPNPHEIKEEYHNKQRELHLKEKNVRMDRHSGTGCPIKESPKKGGAGGGNWGNYKDDIAEAKEDGLL